MYEAFWKQNGDIGTLVTPPWYRLSYAEGTSLDSYATPGLESQIRALHAMVGNAVTEDKSFVISAGSTQMLFAVAQAISVDYPGKTSVVGLTPFYELYKRQADTFGNNKFAWDGDVATFGSTVGKNVLEYVTSPNNPTFLPRRPVLNGSQPVFDLAYYWPSMTPITHAFDEEIMIFTVSKVGGLAGTRLGWAFFKDPELAARVKTVIGSNALTISHDSQARAYQILKAINSVYSKDNGPVPMGLSAARYAAEGRVFHYGRTVLQARYEWLQGILARSSRFSVLKLDAEYCAYFGQKLPPSPAYAWIYCNRDEDEDCYNLFLSSRIKTYPGVNYGATDRHVRFSLFKRDSDYQQLEKYLSVLVAG
jgi:aspartate/methionine/tyrosine aminotransferase